MESMRSQIQRIDQESAIGAMLITNVNEGIGFELLKCVLSDSFYAPHLLILAFRRTPTEDENSNVKSILRSGERDSSRSAKIIVLDTSSDEGILEAFQNISDDLQMRNLSLNVLINNCGMVAAEHSEGVSANCSFLAETRESLNRHFDRAVTSSMMVAKTLLPLLKHAAELRHTRPPGVDRALIVNLFLQLKSREAAMKSYHYRAARAALGTVTWLMAQELTQLHVLVAAVVPGWGSGEMAGKEDSDDEDTATELWSTITKLTADKAGLFINYDGMVMPW